MGDTDSQGNWSIAPDICQALTDGTHPIAAQAANEAGQFSPRSAAIVITIDTNPPAMPVISSPGNNSVIQGGKLTITGKGDPNSIVKVLERAAIRSQTRASGGGAWSVSLSGLASGPHTFRASAVDAAGNESPAFNAITIVVNGAASTPAGTVGGANASPGSVGLSSVKQGSFPRAVNVKRTRTPTPTATATAVTTPLPTITATHVPSNTPTATPLSSATPTATLLPTNTPTPTPLPSSTPTAPATATAVPSPTPAAAVVAMASGDIACGTGSVGNCQQLATSNLLINGNPDVVLPLGDNQYECGALGDFSSFYNSSWGRLLGKTHPTIGNHEYLTSTDPTQPCFNAPAGAPGYFTYFGNAATPNQPGCTSNCGGYYSFNIGAWHIVVLNSVCSQVGGCGLGSPEETWLKNDLAANPTVCTLAYWHYPRYTSGLSGTTFVTGLKTFWQDLYNGGVDIILNGHDHDYERFAPMDVNGNVDTAHGIREFVIGTGGKNLTGFTTSAANSEVWNNNTFGVQKLTLSDGSYAWQFLPISGQTFSDSGSESCR